MKIFKSLIFLLLMAFNFASCQSHTYAPGFDFALFEKTPAKRLAKAVKAEDTLEIVRAIKEDHISVDYKEPEFGRTLLALALNDNKELSVSTLLELGADPNMRNNNDGSPFIDACYYEYDLKDPKKILLMLISHGANVNSIQNDTTRDQFGKKKNIIMTPLGYLCVYGRLESVKVLVDHGAELTSYGPNEHALLSTAILAQKLDIAKYLMIEKKAPIPDYVTIRQPGNKGKKKNHHF